MEFRILGPFEVVDDGREVELGGSRQRALLASLLLRANEVVSSDLLIDGLWGERPPATAPKALQNAVSQLRRSLGDGLIVTRAPGYVLRVAPDRIDAKQFERLLDEGRRALAAGRPEQASAVLGEALGLWRGRVLDEFAYAPFAEAEVARLEELRLRALEERVEADLALGRHADLVGELERLVSEYPLRERLRSQLMVALYRSGRQSEALQVYRDGRRLLAEELGLEAGAALQRLEKQILTQDPALEPPPLVPLPEQARAREQAGVPASGRPRRRRHLMLLLAAVALAGTAVAGAFLLARGDDTPTVIPNSIVKIDPETHAIVNVFPVGKDPVKPAIVGDYVFVSSEEDGTLSRIDVRSGKVDTIGGLASPAAVAAGTDGTLWVGSFDDNHVRQVDANTLDLLQVIELPESTIPWFVAAGGGSVWVSQRQVPGVVSRVDARSGKLQQRYSYTPPNLLSVDIAYGAGAAWAAANSIPGAPTGALLRIDAVGGDGALIEVGGAPIGVGVGIGAVWVTDAQENGRVHRFDRFGRLATTIPVRRLPLGVTTGGGSVWVANAGETTISQIDPRTNTVVDTIDTRYFPYGLVYGRGYLWASLQGEPFNFGR